MPPNALDWRQSMRQDRYASRDEEKSFSRPPGSSQALVKMDRIHQMHEDTVCISPFAALRSPSFQTRGGNAACPQAAYSGTLIAPCGELFFCEERLNLARKGLCDASLATRLLSAR